MAILHGDLVLSSLQAETTVTTHDSTNIIDFGAAHVAQGEKVIISTGVTLTSDGSATVAFSINTGAADTCTTVLHAVTAAAYGTFTAVAGNNVVEFILPWEVQRYLKIIYTIGGAALTAGKFNAYVDDVRQTNGL